MNALLDVTTVIFLPNVSMSQVLLHAGVYLDILEMASTVNVSKINLKNFSVSRNILQRLTHYSTIIK